MATTMEFLDEIPIDIPSALEQLLGRFQAVRAGLPELVKNSKDQYARLKIVERSERVIVVIANSETKRLAVLDFGGATHEDFQHWLTWADPYANRGEGIPDVEGGHGDGGKGAMCRGSTEESFFDSCRDGLRTKMGFSTKVENRRYYPAYFKEGGQRLDRVKVTDPRKHLDTVLADLGTKFSELPELARTAFEKRKSFSVVQLNGVRDWSAGRSTVRQLVRALPEELVQQPQAALSIESCSIFFIVDGKRQSDAPLEYTEPEPMAGFEKLPPIAIPPELPDPKTGEMVTTGAPTLTSLPHGLVSPRHQLLLKTSAKSLRIGQNKPLNVVRVRNARNVVGNWSVADLYSQASSAFIYGSLTVPTMGLEHQVGADRVALADTPLVRALEAWTSAQVEDLAAKIQKALSKEHKPEELEKANDGLQQMRDAMREFLEQAMLGKGRRGSEDGDEGEPNPPPGRVVRQIILEDGAQAIAIARGTKVPLMLRAYDLSSEGKKLLIPRAKLDFRSDPPNVVSISEHRILKAESAGRAQIWFRDPATGVESNRVEVDVVRAVGARITAVPARLLLQGETVSLGIVFSTRRGERGPTEDRRDLLVEAAVDEPLLGRVDRFGAFQAGGQEGTATVRVRYGSGPTDSSVTTLEVGPDRVTKPPRKGSDSGPDVPIILLCGDEAPGMEQYPPEARTIPPLEQHPTIIDYEPPFEPNVIFINQGSRESFQVRFGKGGRRGTAGLDTGIFLQFLAIKCFEILKRLYVRQTFKEGVMSQLEFRLAFAEAETTCAPFIDKAFEIARELTTSLKDQL